MNSIKENNRINPFKSSVLPIFCYLNYFISIVWNKCCWDIQPIHFLNIRLNIPGSNSLSMHRDYFIFYRANGSFIFIDNNWIKLPVVITGIVISISPWLFFRVLWVLPLRLFTLCLLWENVLHIQDARLSRFQAFVQGIERWVS